MARTAGKSASNAAATDWRRSPAGTAPADLPGVLRTLPRLALKLLAYAGGNLVVVWAVCSLTIAVVRLVWPPLAGGTAVTPPFGAGDARVDAAVLVNTVAAALALCAILFGAG